MAASASIKALCYETNPLPPSSRSLNHVPEPALRPSASLSVLPLLLTALPRLSSWTLSGRTKTPRRAGQEKYRTPFTEPSFLPES